MIVDNFDIIEILTFHAKTNSIFVYTKNSNTFSPTYKDQKTISTGFWQVILISRQLLTAINFLVLGMHTKSVS